MAPPDPSKTFQYHTGMRRTRRLRRSVGLSRNACPDRQDPTTSLLFQTPLSRQTASSERCPVQRLPLANLKTRGCVPCDTSRCQADCMRRLARGWNVLSPLVNS
eukprot:1013194-Prymnesium_polylepis.1